MKTACLILAAGESRRMGCSKALLDYRGSTFLDTLVALFSPRCAPVIVVVGAGADEVRARAQLPATFILNPNYERGQITSMQCGLRAAPPDADGVLFTLVDHPAVSRATLDALLNPPAMLEGAPALLRVPRYQGRRGHPIWLSRELIPEFLALPESGSARDVVSRHAAHTAWLDLDDPGIVADIDDPAAYRALIEARP